MAEPERRGPLVMRLFTHPACSGCPEAVRRAWDFARAHPGVELRTVSLVEAEGLAAARAERVNTIPTLILLAGEDEIGRWVGMPPVDEIRGALGAR